MFNSKNRQYFLSIETTINGGSLALFKGIDLISEWSGSQTVSKAEDVLEEIFRLLSKGNIKKTQIAAIIVSKSEGSLTAGKIGGAIAQGLAKAIGCQLIERSLIDSIASFGNTEESGSYLALIPIGNFRFGWKIFQKKSGNLVESKNEYEISTPEQIETLLKKSNIIKMFVPFFHDADKTSLKFDTKIETIGNGNLANVNAREIILEFTASDNNRNLHYTFNGCSSKIKTGNC